jgi:hypothetical protein
MAANSLFNITSADPENTKSARAEFGVLKMYKSPKMNMQIWQFDDRAMPMLACTRMFEN